MTREQLSKRVEILTKVVDDLRDYIDGKSMLDHAYAVRQLRRIQVFLDQLNHEGVT